MVDGAFYKRGVNDILLQYISQADGTQLLTEIHNGMCGSHTSYRMLIGKAFRHEFYWPTAKQDAMHIVRTCEV